MRTIMGIMSILAVLFLGCDSGTDDGNGDNSTCGYDEQCEGDRICVEGLCVSLDASRAIEGGTSNQFDSETAVCGNGRCDKESGEGCDNCPEDCANCRIMTCGDGICSEDICENCANCKEDCGQCTEVKCNCGDGVCDAHYCEETCSNCEDDCGSCDDESDGGSGESTSPMPGYFYCGNEICEPGEDEQCEDCASLLESTCENRCVSDCECEQPWTACGVGISPICSPIGCEACYEENKSCCWCPKASCGNVTCVNQGEQCPSC